MHGDWDLLIAPFMFLVAGIFALLLKVILFSIIYFVGAGILFYIWLDWW